RCSGRPRASCPTGCRPARPRTRRSAGCSTWRSPGASVGWPSWPTPPGRRRSSTSSTARPRPRSWPVPRPERPATAGVTRRPPPAGRGAAAVEAALRAWRRERSRADGVPAYVVLNDRHLRGIAERRPRTERELAACPGIGPAKLAAYGDELLALVARATEGVEG